MAAKLTPDQELWDSGDELGDGKPLQRKGTMPERIKTRPGWDIIRFRNKKNRRGFENDK